MVAVAIGVIITYPFFEEKQSLSMEGEIAAKPNC